MARIGVVEEEQTLCTLIVNELQKRDHEVWAAMNGQYGWELIRDEKPEVVLLGLLVSIMNWYQLLELIKSEPSLKHVQCIVISDSSHIDHVNHVLALGAQAVLIRAEFSPEELIAKVEEVLKKARENKLLYE